MMATGGGGRGSIDRDDKGWQEGGGATGGGQRGSIDRDDKGW
jgi:hypothetical protein